MKEPALARAIATCHHACCFWIGIALHRSLVEKYLHMTLAVLAMGTGAVQGQQFYLPFSYSIFHLINTTHIRPSATSQSPPLSTLDNPFARFRLSFTKRRNRFSKHSWITANASRFLDL
jgi:hypothetical protein